MASDASRAQLSAGQSRAKLDAFWSTSLIAVTRHSLGNV
jgi:hypothetical protein